VIIDVHVHARGKETAKDVIAALDDKGVDRAVVFAPSGNRAGAKVREHIDFISRLAKETGGRVIPFAFIDCSYEHAVEEVERAVADKGIKGVKIIPDGWPAWGDEAQRVYAKAQELGVPILFHTGILWSWGDTSRFCRPCEFEIMMEYPKVRFAMAHIGWPWTDECLAVAGKIMYMRRGRKHEGPQAFVDLTPGTPPIYREDAVRKALTYLGDDLILYGSDSVAGRLNDVLARDRELFARMGLSAETQEKIFSKNALVWLGEK
jgi:predicted TIM-barrel fold metal-dependent hydrolase